MKPIGLVYYMMAAVVLVFAVTQTKPESLAYYAIIAVVLALAAWWLTGQPPWQWLSRQPTVWDIVWLIFAIAVPFVSRSLGDGLVALLVLVAAGLGIMFVGRRLERSRAEVAR